MWITILWTPLPPPTGHRGCPGRYRTDIYFSRLQFAPVRRRCKRKSSAGGRQSGQTRDRSAVQLAVTRTALSDRQATASGRSVDRRFDGGDHPVDLVVV